MRYLVLVNPAAGRGRAPARAARLGAALEALGERVLTYTSRRPGDAGAHAARQAAGATDRLVVVGGDGTLREVIEALGGRAPWPIGLLPQGTANVVGRELGMHGVAPEEAARRLVAARERPVDLLRVNRAGAPPSFALANVGAGLDGAVVHRIARLRAGGAGGYARWIGPIWTTLRREPPARLLVTVDERVTWLAAGVVVQNARNYGGLFALAADAALDSGALDVMLVRGRTVRDRFRLLARMGLGGLARDRAARFVKARRVRLTARAPVPVQADGDPAGTTDLEVELLPRALTLLHAG